MPYMNENLFIASLIRQFVPKKKKNIQTKGSKKPKRKKEDKQEEIPHENHDIIILKVRNIQSFQANTIARDEKLEDHLPMESLFLCTAIALSSI